MSTGVNVIREGKKNRRLSGICGFCLALFGLKFFFLVLLDVFVHGLWEFEVAIDVSAVGVVGIGENWELLLGVPGENAIAARGIVVATFDLAEEGCNLFGVCAGIFRQPVEHRVLRKKVMTDHGEDEASMVSDVLTGVESIEQVIHHGLVAERGEDLVLVVLTRIGRVARLSIGRAVLAGLGDRLWFCTLKRFQSLFELLGTSLGFFGAQFGIAEFFWSCCGIGYRGA
jgi:hypothetical protein